MNSRLIAWFSCGATSAVMAKLLCTEPEIEPLVIAYTYVKEEHPDNQRFLKDCERWFHQEITVLMNEEYGGSIYEVFRRKRFLVGPHGAACTRLLKREVRERVTGTSDIHALGFSSDEQDRADEFRERNPQMHLRFPLIERLLTKSDCLAIVQDAGIALPALYRQGYEHNNCIGCVKGGAGYWNKIRVDYPEVFARMATVERDIGHSILKTGYLDELDPQAGRGQKEPSIECGIFCEMAKQELGSSTDSSSV